MNADDLFALADAIHPTSGPSWTTARSSLSRRRASRKQRGYRAARSKLRAAAALNPFYHWIEARYSAPNENWELEQL